MNRDEAIQALMDELRRRIQDLREKSDMTQDELAEAAGWSQSNLSKFLRGETVPGIDKLLGLQYALGLQSLDELFAPLPVALSGELLAAARSADQGNAPTSRWPSGGQL